MLTIFRNVEIYYLLQKGSLQICNKIVRHWFGRLQDYAEIIFHNWWIYELNTVGNDKVTKESIH